MNALQLILRYVTAPFRFLLKGPTYLIAAPRRVWGLQPPARAAALMAASLILCTTIVVLAFIFSDKPVHGDYLRDPKWIIAMLGVLIATPAATYYLIKMLLTGDVSRYPDIDAAWDAGIEALAATGRNISDFPLYVLLGTPNEAACDSVLAAGRLTPVVAGAPRGPAPLHWYATEDAIYLACTGFGQLGKLSHMAATSAGEMQAGFGAANPVTATMVVGGGRQKAPSMAVPSESTAASERGRILGTMVAGAGSASGHGETAAASSGMSRKEAEEQSARLRHASNRLRRARQPYCANNGVLTILPHEVLNDVVYAKEVPEAVRADLAVLREATRLSSSVTMLVTGMEADEGFTELVRRVGIDKARSSRFGKGFDVWNVASDENLDALSTHACGSFEDWVYTLFAGDDGTEQRSNGKLFSMLCRVRRHLQPRLRGVLVNGYAVEHENNGDFTGLFSGCYFAATGRQREEQAFVRSVFEKLDQLSEDLQWSSGALSEEANYRWASWVINAANAVLLTAVGFLAYRCIVLFNR